MQEKEVERIERLNPIVEVAVELGLEVHGHLGVCFNSDRHAGETEPALFFNVARNSFLCRTCEDIGGGVIDFVCQYKQWDRRKAVDWLVHRIEFDQQTREIYYHRRGKRRKP